MGLFDKKPKKSKQKSISSIPPGIPREYLESVMQYDSPLSIIKSTRELINLYASGVFNDNATRTIAYVMSCCIIPAYKLHMEQELLERYKRIEEGLKQARERGSIAKSDLPRLPVSDKVEYVYEGRKKKE